MSTKSPRQLRQFGRDMTHYAYQTLAVGYEGIASKLLLEELVQ
jgi:hypothetical protein